MCEGGPIRIIDVMIPDLLTGFAAVVGAVGLVVLVLGGIATAKLDEGA